jgi:hypothetical protein
MDEEIEQAIANISSVAHFNDDGDHLEYVDREMAGASLADALSIIESFYEDGNLTALQAMTRVTRSLVHYRHEVGM